MALAPAISVENLGKCFRFYPSKWDKLRGALLRGRNHYQELWAVRNLSFSLHSGTTFGIIGANGAGKTTLLQLLAGLLRPSEGRVEVNGNLATLLELGGGFQMELTGRENIFVSAGLRGFSRREIVKRIDEIIDFSGLREFIDRPVKHYSAGMQVRLAFSTAINVDPEVLLIDEVFSVGDMEFQHKCTHKFRELQKKGTTVVLVTHDMTAIKSLCTQALLLNDGEPNQIGSPDEVTNTYLRLVTEKIAQEESRESPVAETIPVQPLAFAWNVADSVKSHRHGTGEGRITGIQILNSRLLPVEATQFGEDVTFRFFIEYLADVPESGLGFYIRDRLGNDIIGINTFEEGRTIGLRKKGDRMTVDFLLPLYLRPGSYSISPGFAYNPIDLRYLDWIDNAAFFVMEKPMSGRNIHGFVHVPNEVTIREVEDHG